MAQHGITHRGEKPYKGGVLYELDVCPFNTEHRGGSSCITVAANGAIGFKCQHAGCLGRKWAHVRDLFEPNRNHGSNGRAERFTRVDAEIDAGLYGEPPDEPAEPHESDNTPATDTREQRIATFEAITT